MRVAVAGKGGVGKTTIAGTLARALAADGDPVLAVDADPNPNLGLTLGVPADRFDAIVPLPHSLLEHRRVDGEHRAVLAKPIDEVVEAYGSEAPDGIRLLSLGRPQRAGGG